MWNPFPQSLSLKGFPKQGMEVFILVYSKTQLTTSLSRHQLKCVGRHKSQESGIQKLKCA